MAWGDDDPSPGEVATQQGRRPTRRGWGDSDPEPETGASKKRAGNLKKGAFGEVFGGAMNLFRSVPGLDEGAAAMDSGLRLATGQAHSIPEAWKQSRDLQDANADDFQKRRPTTTAVIKGTGNSASLLVPATRAANVFANSGRAMNAARGAAVAAGTAYGYGVSDRGTLAERGRAGFDAATDPAVLALGAGGGALAGRGVLRAPTAPKRKAPTLEELTAQKNAAYKAVDDSGVTFRPEAFRTLTEDMAMAADAEGFHAGLHPKTAAMLERLGASNRASGGHAPTLTQLDQLRQQIGNDVAGSADAGERRMGKILIAQIDDFISAAGPEHLSGGNGPQSAQTLLKARELNTRVSKLRSLDNLDDAADDRAAATGSGGNINNATRQNAIRFKNKTRNLTPAERDATQKVISGTPAGNALRQVGKLSPQGNGLMLAGHLAAAVPSHGFSGIAAVGGAAAKMASDAITARNVQALRELIASGGEVAEEVTRQLSTAKGPEADALRRAVAARLTVGAGAVGGSASSGNLFARP